MASLTITDMLSRTAVAEPEKKKKWIQKAVPQSRRGVFKAKAERAGKTTAEYAKEKENAGGELGHEAKLAETLMGMNKTRRKKLYTHPRSHHG